MRPDSPALPHDRPAKPVGLWRDHARHRRRRNRLARVRAYLSMAGFRDRAMLAHIPDGSRILDVGCGGGRPLLAEIGRVTGLEPDPQLAALAREIYPEVMESGAQAMPFSDGQFDAVVSTDIIGHIPNDLKPAMFAEVFRVLRPGGVTLHIAETASEDCRNWLARIARREPKAYWRSWIVEPDHNFMESPAATAERFRQAGFVIDVLRPIQPLIPEWGSFHGALRHYVSLPWWLRALRGVDRVLCRSAAVRELANLALTPLALINHFGRIEQGTGILLVAHRP